MHVVLKQFFYCFSILNFLPSFKHFWVLGKSTLRNSGYLIHAFCMMEFPAFLCHQLTISLPFSAITKWFATNHACSFSSLAEQLSVVWDGKGETVSFRTPGQVPGDSLVSFHLQLVIQRPTVQLHATNHLSSYWKLSSPGTNTWIHAEVSLLLLW